MCENSSKLTIKTPEQHHWHKSDAFIDNFEHISPIALVFLFFDFEQMSAKYGVRLLANLHTVRRPVLTFNFPKTETHKSLISLDCSGNFRKATSSPTNN